MAALSVPFATQSGGLVPRTDMRARVASEIRTIFNAPDRQEAKQLLDSAVAAQLAFSHSAPGLST